MPSPEDCLLGGGGMGALMRAFDWSRTPVGAVARWPQSLRTAVSMMLETRFGMYIAWGPGFTQFYNDGYRPILGSTKHPAIGRSTRDTFAEIWPIIGPMFEGVLRGDAVGYEDMMLPLDRHGFAEECYFIFSYSPIRDESGTVGGVLVTVTETTGRVLAQRRLGTLRDLAASAASTESVADAWRRSFDILAANASDLPLAVLFELDGSRVRLVGASGVGRGSRFAPEAMDLHEESTWGLRTAIGSPAPTILTDLIPRCGPLSGGPWPEPPHTGVVLPIRRAGAGTPYGVLVAGLSPRLLLDDAYMEFLSMVAGHVGTAIANASAYEEERRRAEALAEIDRAKTVFFSNVSHEFRTPLTLILGPLQELAATSGPALRERLLPIHRNAQRLLKLVNSLLDFARIEAGRTQASYLPTDLSRLTADLASTFRSAVERAGLQLVVDCPPLPQPIYVDRDQWEKIVLNLLSNAFKFTFEGTIAVRLSWTGAGARLEVCDTGTGIAPEEVSRIFERFHRVPGVRARTHEGTGIGLSLVQELVRQHGGTIAVDSEPSRGTTFSIVLPAGADHLPADRLALPPGVASTTLGAAPFVEEALRWLPDAGEALEPLEGAEPAFGALTPAHVLVADDNADMRDYLRRVLSPHWRVTAVADGLAALERVRADRPDLILTDVMMPGLDGFALLQAVRADAEVAQIPVVMLSARAGEEARVEGLHAGADDYIVKPFSARELVARIEAQLLRARVSAAEAAGRRAAEAASRAKDEFIAMLGHELRNPLSPILAALQLMELRGSGEYQRERAVIERQVRHLIRLVDDLLDMSRITRGKIDLNRSRVTAREVVTRAVEMAGPLLDQRGHALHIDVAPGAVLFGDATRLAQVFSNLLNNAAKFTDAGGRIDVRGRVEQDRYVITVTDSGMGIPAALLPHVFDMFVQGGQSIDRTGGGLGLGLALVRTLVSLHGGTVEAHSAGEGLGSTFTVRLPLAAHESPCGPMEAVAAPATIPPRRVLVVDDNREAAELLADLLRLDGHAVQVTFNGRDALQAAAALRPDVALLDIGLPVIDGYELASRLRELVGGGLRLVAISGYGQPHDRDRTVSAGFDAHLVKPIDHDHVRAVLGPAPLSA
ncbi:MAG TPA: ATP-binding protein [Vicinamibacterales bacterium]|nr:ATP-binding protein [Vicinamibacterales bacterium]